MALQLKMTLARQPSFSPAQQSGLVDIFKQLLVDHASSIELSAFTAQPASTSVGAYRALHLSCQDGLHSL